MTSRLLRLSVVLLVATVLASLVQSLLFQHFYVSGSSMGETLHAPDRVLVEKISKRFGGFDRGDIVVFEMDMGEGRLDLIKRVVGLPGELVEVQDCLVRIDGEALAEPYLHQDRPRGCGGHSVGPLRVGPDEYFVMGDNREHSADSRLFGPVPGSRFVGRAVVVVWPLGAWRLL